MRRIPRISVLRELNRLQDSNVSMFKSSTLFSLLYLGISNPQMPTNPIGYKTRSHFVEDSYITADDFCSLIQCNDTLSNVQRCLSRSGNWFDIFFDRSNYPAQLHDKYEKLFQCHYSHIKNSESFSIRAQATTVIAS
jgi:hypothetical protein